MAEHGGEVTTGKKVAYAIGALVFAFFYFIYFLDIALMKIQGLDYCYNFPDWIRKLCF